MRQAAEGIDTAVVRQQCKVLKLPTIAAQFEALAGEAAHRNQSHTSYLQALFAAELDERERRLIERRVREARIPRMKTLEEFDFTKSPNISASLVRELSEGGYVTRGESVVLIGECGTGKTHLATGL
jgi:DNA replication protein DnaC